MNLFDRFTRVVKSNANEILKNLEDPEKIMNQALEDMQVRSQLGGMHRSGCIWRTLCVCVSRYSCAL